VETFIVVGVVATAVQTVALTALHLLPTGYNPKVDAVSDYGIGRQRGVFRSLVGAGGLGGVRARHRTRRYQAVRTLANDRWRPAFAVARVPTADTHTQLPLSREQQRRDGDWSPTVTA